MSVDATERLESRGLRSVGARAMGWQALATVVVQVLQALLTLTVAAVTAPTEFALWGIASIVFNAQNLLAGLGLGEALIYFKDEKRPRDAVDSAFVTTSLLGVVFAGAIALCAGPIASGFEKGFDHDEVVSVIEVMSLVLVFTTIATVPQALIERTLDFRRRAIPEMACAVGYAVAVLGMLAAGLGIWSLIVGKVLQTLLLLLAFWAAAPVKPRLRPRPRWEVTRRMIGYGKFMSGAGIIAFATGNLDTFAVGLLAGAGALGAYALSYTVTNIVPTFMTQTTGRVFFPIYAAVRERHDALVEAYSVALHYLAVVMLPTTAALALLGPEALLDVFGDEWEAAAPLIAILAVYGLLRAVGAQAATLLGAIGRADQKMVTHGIALVASVVLLLPLAGLDATGVAWAFTAGQAASMTYGLVRVRHLWPRGLPGLVAGAAAATTAALAAGIAVRVAAPGAVDGPLAAAAFAAVYSCALPAFDRDIRRGMSSLKVLRARVRPTEA